MFMTTLDLMAKNSLRNHSLTQFMDLLKDGWHVEKLTSWSIILQKNGKHYSMLFAA